MRASTAFAFILAGISLMAVGESSYGAKKYQRISQGCALAVVILAGFIFIEHLFSLGAGIDPLLPKNANVYDYGQMPLITAFDFILMGSALLSLGINRNIQVAQTLGLLGGMIALLSLTGFAYYSSKSQYGLASYSQMPVYTAATLLLLSVGIFSVYPDKGLMTLVMGESIGGKMIRRLVPITIVVLLILGWLRLIGEENGLYGTEFGVALMVFLSISILSAVIWWNARYLDRIDRERSHAEERIKQSEERLRTLFDGAPVGIVLRREGIVLDANNSYLSMFGFKDLSEIKGRSFLEFIAPQSRNETYEISRKREAGEAVPTEYESVGLRRDGSQFPIYIEAALIRLSDGPATVIFIIDITERKRAEDELAQRTADLVRSNAELQQFAYVASHDLQEPLRMVTSYVQLLQKRYRNKLDPDADEFIAYAVDGATRMQQLINDLLTYSRIGTRGKPFEPTDFNRVFDRAVSNLKVAIDESGATVTHDPLPTLMVDGTQMVQLMQNLIGNGIKFHGQEVPIVNVSAQRKGNDWVFSVKDNGIGIDPQFKDRIFVIFQRLHSRSEYPGTGIGLAISKKIVERHGGRIWFESEPGKGSTFFFTIPLKDKDIIKGDTLHPAINHTQ
ncbi:MAG: ATP-binding protein [Methanotrichaceae archaeon]